ncbi:hypothetical protein NDU88_009333 [Pleurodeles waltl]|uniref:Uncharacterized protein n=1 Tax=Pleurodeles waltl TaxID=8319 RepID=A0AAV7PVJ8_PLEWA|nr:hypothetical protein NDU88_009333 [Pleurodeles waltl]
MPSAPCRSSTSYPCSRSPASGTHLPSVTTGNGYLASPSSLGVRRDQAHFQPACSSACHFALRDSEAVARRHRLITQLVSVPCTLMVVRYAS